MAADGFEALTITANIPVTRARGVAARDGSLAIIGENEIVCCDVHEPSQPKITGRAPIAGTGYDVRLKGDYAFVAARLGGVQIFRLTGGQTQWVATHDAIEQATGIALHGNLLLVCNRTVGFEVVDVSDPLRPRHVGKVKTAEAQGVAARGNYAYVGEHFLKSLTVVDIADPSQPRLVDRWATTPYYRNGPDCWEVAVSGAHLFLVDGDNGFLVLTSPSRITY